MTTGYRVQVQDYCHGRRTGKLLYYCDQQELGSQDLLRNTKLKKKKKKYPDPDFLSGLTVVQSCDKVVKCEQGSG